MRVRKFLGMNPHFVITEPRNILLFRLQHLSMKLSGTLHVSKVVSDLNSHFKILRLDVQQEGVDPFAFMMSSRSDNALSIDKEVTNQGTSRVGLWIQLVHSKPLDGG